MATLDGRRQLTLSLNPWIEGDPGPALIDLVLTSFCQPSEANRAAMALKPPRIFKPW